MLAAMQKKCLRGEEKTNLFACLFLQRLSHKIRVLLSRVNDKDLKLLAEETDTRWTPTRAASGGGHHERPYGPPQAAFQSRKDTVCKAAQLDHLDPEAEINPVQVDTSNTHIGAILQQKTVVGWNHCPRSSNPWRLIHLPLIKNFGWFSPVFAIFGTCLRGNSFTR